MASSGGKPRSSLSKRQMVGLFSLGLGVVLFLLILMRGQQAAREGNQEISNDTYWVLVSPLVFSAFGVVLLRSPKAGAGARGRTLVQSQRTTQSAQAALARGDEGASQQLAQARAEAASARWVDCQSGAAAGPATQRGRPSPGGPRPTSRRPAGPASGGPFEQGAPAFVAAAPTAATGSDAFLSCYREACEELGVLPGSGWQDVRATLRLKVMDWHPDQGGDSRLWVRRNAAYQLLVAWYEFNGAS